MNILLTCAGRRSYLVDYFKEALGDNGLVHTANSISDAPAMLVSDRQFVTASIYSKDYVESIISYCKTNDIQMVVSLLDLELTILAAEKDRFTDNNIFLAISDYEVCQTCNDKWETQEFLIQNGFNTVKMFLNPEEAIENVKQGEAKFPFFIKPRWGMGSIGVYQADDEEELKVLFKKVRKQLKSTYLNEGSKAFKDKDVIIQETLAGQEYGMDVFNDFEGHYIRTFVKKKIAMRSGETDAAISCDNESLEDLGQLISQKLKHLGNLDVDVFFDGKQAYILELNPRFGGGYPFTHLAGGNIVKAYVDLYNGKNFSFDFVSDIKGIKTIHISNLGK